MITVQRWRQGYLAKLGGGFPVILQQIGGAKRAPPVKTPSVTIFELSKYSGIYIFFDFVVFYIHFMHKKNNAMFVKIPNLAHPPVHASPDEEEEGH